MSGGKIFFSLVGLVLVFLPVLAMIYTNVAFAGGELDLGLTGMGTLSVVIGFVIGGYVFLDKTKKEVKEE